MVAKLVPVMVNMVPPLEKYRKSNQTEEEENNPNIKPYKTFLYELVCLIINYILLLFLAQSQHVQ